MVKGSTDCKLIICGSNDEVYLQYSVVLLYLLFCTSSNQNELILVGVLDTVFDTISALLRGQFDKRVMLDNLELILLTIDEVVSTYVWLLVVHNSQCED